MALDKENFDLKMQIQNLQEQLRKSTSRLDSSGSGGGDAALKLELQERQIELNERNLLLSKAKTAITEMRKELERVRRENDPAIRVELEARVAKLKKANEDIEAECRKQVNSMEVELVTTKEKYFLLDEAKAKAETRLEQVELSLTHAEQRLAELRDEKAKVDENWLLLQQKADRMEDEITQARAHVELFRMETQEAIEERDSIREQLVLARDSTHVADQLAAQREELQNKHHEAMERLENLHQKAVDHYKMEQEKAIESAKTALAQEKHLHEKHLMESTQRHETELSRLREEMTNTKDELRLERQREREEAAARMDEKASEIKFLHTQLENQRNKADHLLKEAEAARVDLESAKVELGFRSDQVDQFKSETQELHAEVKLLKRSHEQAAELRESLRREQGEKEALTMRYTEENDKLQHKLDQLTETLDNLKHSYHEKESRAKLAESELTTIKASHSTVETISRDNEKVKAEVQRLTQELLTTTHESSNLKRDLEHANNLIATRDKTIELQTAEITHMERENASLQTIKEELNEILRADREKHTGMEAVLAELHRSTEGSIAEHKGVAANFKQELDQIEQRYLTSEKARVIIESRYESIRHDYVGRLQTEVENLESWDDALAVVVEGVEGFAGTERYEREQRLLSDSTKSITRALNQKGFLSKGIHGAINDDDINSHLLPAINSLTERIKIRVRTIAKLRHHLQQQTNKQMDAMLKQFENVQQRTQLLSLRLDASVENMSRTNALLDRDRKALQQEAQEGKIFREQTMMQLHANANSLKDVEERRAKEISDLQKELIARDRAAEAAARDIAQRDNIISELRAEVDAYGQAEQVVHELSDRLQDVVAAKENLAANLAETSHNLEAAQQEFAEVQADRAELADRCEYYEKENEVLQRELTGAAATIETLRASQITPELTKMIQDTQMIIRASKMDQDDLPKSDSPYLNSHLGIQLPQSPQPMERPFVATAAPPVNAYSQYAPQVMLSSSPLPNPPAARTPLGSMLDSRPTSVNTAPIRSTYNVDVTKQIQTNRGLHQANSSPVSLSNSSHIHKQDHSSRRLNTTNGHSDAMGSASSGRKLSSVFNTRQSPTATGGARSPLLAAASPQLQTYVRSAPNFTSGTPQRSQIQFAVPEHNREIAASPAPSLRTPGTQRNATPTSSTNLTPNTQTRQSVSRLHKLGSDIEALARKLDGFDSADRNRWK